MAIRNGSLVLYKNHPAVVLAVEGKLELQLPDAARRRVRAKDVQLLHPGPVGNLGDFRQLKVNGFDVCDSHDNLDTKTRR